jgi:hypothetical protein
VVSPILPSVTRISESAPRRPKRWDTSGSSFLLVSHTAFRRRWRMSARMAKARFQLPSCEDDLWHEIIVRLLGQRDITESLAVNPLRLLEEWSFHRVFCGRRRVDREWLERVAEWIAQTEPRRGPVHQVGQWIDRLKDWDFASTDADGHYEFTIPTLDEYFAARHLAARWTDARYCEWLPRADRWWEHSVAFPCPNSECGVLLPPFRELLGRTEYEETLLLLVGLLRDEEREEQFLTGMRRHLNLMLKALLRCRHGHDGLAAAVVAALVREGLLWSCEEGLRMLGGARVEAVRVGIVAPLTAAFYSAEAELCVPAATALEIIGHEVVNPLIAALDDPDPVVRGQAAEVLGNIGDGRAVAPLTVALRDPDPYVRSDAAKALGLIGMGKLVDRRTVEAMIVALGDPDYYVRSEAATALGYVRAGRAVLPLLTALRDPEPRVRSDAALALGSIEDARAVDPLIDALGDADADVRASAARALGWIGSLWTAEPMRQLLRDESASVREAVREALSDIGRRADTDPA